MELKCSLKGFHTININSKHLSDLCHFIKWTENAYPFIEDDNIKQLKNTISSTKPFNLNTTIISLENYINNTQTRPPVYQQNILKTLPVDEYITINNQKIKTQIFKASTPKSYGSIYMMNEDNNTSNQGQHEYLGGIYSSKGFNVTNICNQVKPEVFQSIMSDTTADHISANNIKRTLMLTSLSPLMNIIPKLPSNLYSSIVMLLVNKNPFDITKSSTAEIIKKLNCPIYTFHVIPSVITEQVNKIVMFLDHLHSNSQSTNKIRVILNNSYNRQIEEIYHNDISNWLRLL